MGRIPPERAIKALPNYSPDELWKLRYAIDEQLAQFEPERFADKFTNQVVDAASILASKYFENGFEPYMRGKYHLQFLVNVLDVFCATLDEKAFRKYVDDATETELSGTWYQQLRMASGVGIDLRIAAPEVTEGVEARLKALSEFLNTNDSAPLRQIAKHRLNLDELDIPNHGRPSVPTELTAYTLHHTRRLTLLHGLKTRREKIEHFTQFLETHTDVQEWKANPRSSLQVKASQALEAYMFFYVLSPEQAVEKLRDMERKNPNHQ